MSIILEDLNLRKAEQALCKAALDAGGSIVEAATLLGITRHALKRRIVKHRIEWPTASASRDDLHDAPLHDSGLQAAAMASNGL